MNLLLLVIAAVYLLKLYGLFRLWPAGMSTRALLLYLFTWPGANPRPFAVRAPAFCNQPSPVHRARYRAGWLRLLLGAICILLLARFAPQIPTRLLGLAGIAAMLLTLHFGLGELIPFWLHRSGHRLGYLFDRPWAATSLTDFWSRRWNLAFVEMDRLFLLRPIHRLVGRKWAIFTVFALSGLVHELGVSLSSGGGYGQPFLYFAGQGALVTLESRSKQSHSKLWTWGWLLLPSPLLFHAPFCNAYIVPFYTWLHRILTM